MGAAPTVMPPRGGAHYSSARSSPGPACSHAPSIQPGSSGESAAASGDDASKAASPRILIRTPLPLLRAWLPATALGEYQSFTIIHPVDWGFDRDARGRDQPVDPSAGKSEARRTGTECGST